MWAETDGLFLLICLPSDKCLFKKRSNFPTGKDTDLASEGLD